MLSDEEREWLKENFNKRTSRGVKTILFQHRVNTRIRHYTPSSIEVMAGAYDEVERDYNEYYRENAVFGDQPQPEGKE